MNDTEEVASTASPLAKTTPSQAVADLLRTHPSKPAAASVSPLLRDALGFDASCDRTAADWRDAGASEVPDDRDAMSPARGVLVGLALTLPFWGIVGMAIRSLLR